MRHSSTRATRKFGRTSDPRRALMRSLARNLIVSQKIITTEAKAKSLRPFIERLLTHARKGTLASRRLVATRLGGRNQEAQKLINDIAPRMQGRSGGYTRIVKLAPRKGDASPRALIEFVA